MEYRKLERNGKCICCGRLIPRHIDNVFRFPAHKSQTGVITICKKCIEDMFFLAQGECAYECYMKYEESEEL